MRRWSLRSALVAACLAIGGLGVPDVSARPTYFDTFTGLYGFSAGDNLHACGVCHFLWTGTGGRNLYGSAVEQQLYLGKSITQSIEDVEGADSDGDGFTNIDEIATFETLPGYSCDNFFNAIGAPLGYHTYITPGVASCLEPLDIRVAPSSVSFLTSAAEVDVVPVEIFNNGSDFPLSISTYEFLGGAAPEFGLSGPAAPLSIPVGQSIVVDVSFAPVGPLAAAATLRISSDDPDEPDVDVPITGIGIFTPLGPPLARAGCLNVIDRQLRRYTRKHLREWGTCYLDELTGVACDTGRRDLRLLRAEARLRKYLGGSKDTKCLGNNLSPALMGFPSTCGGTCDGISLNSMSSLASCLICRQEEAMETAFAAALGTAPPDLPPNLLTGKAYGCQRRVLAATRKSIARIQKTLGRCELENVTSLSPVDCAAAYAAEVAAVQTKLDGQIDRCNDTSGMLGCLFEPSPVATCLGDTAGAIGSGLVDAAFGL